MAEYISDIPNAPKAIGPYSPLVLSQGFAFLSGQIPLDPATGKLVGDSIEAQTEQVLKNIAAILSVAGLTFRNVVKTTIFLTDLGTFQTVNKIYEASLGGARPARSTVQVAALPMGSKIEIEMLAEHRS